VGSAPKAMVYPKTYLGDVPELSEAEWIELVPGRDAEVQIRMKARRGLEVSGQVVPLAPEISVHMVSSSRILIPTPMDWDEINQRFRFYRLPPGRYVLLASAENNGKRLSAKQSIVISEADIKGIVLELREDDQ
jgi:hypothetical protein